MIEQSLLSDLSPDARAEVLRHTVVMEARAGTWLFRQGDPAEAMYVVESGRLEVVDEGAGAVLRVLGPGAVLGEIGLLTGLPRTASARARRDSRLLRLDGSVLTDLLGGTPGLALALTRATALRLAHPPAGSDSANPTSVVALVPVTGAVDMTGVETAVRAALGKLVPRPRVAVAGPEDVQDGDVGFFARSLDSWEREHDVVVLTTERLLPAAAGAWTDFCLRSADRTVVLVGPSDRPDRCAPAIRRLRDRLPGPPDLCFLDPPGVDQVTDWSRALPPRAHHLVGTKSPATAAEGFGRMTRRVLRRAVGVVLSGGGARGFAHLGVVASLEEAGVRVDRVGGCSMGAIMGALVAAGHEDEVRVEMARHYFVTSRPLGDYTVPRTSLVQGTRMRVLMREAFGDGPIELLPLPFFCLSADLVTAEPVVHRRGPLWPALVASASIPGLLPPVAMDGRLLVDGGVLDNLPIGVSADEDEGPVVAVDVMRPFTPGGQGRGRRMPRWPRRSTTPDAGVPPAAPPIAEVLGRATVLGSWRTVEANRHRAALTVTVPDDGTGWLRWDRLDGLVDIGRRATEQALTGPDAAALLGGRWS